MLAPTSNRFQVCPGYCPGKLRADKRHGGLFPGTGHIATDANPHALETQPMDRPEKRLRLHGGVMLISELGEEIYKLIECH